MDNRRFGTNAVGWMQSTVKWMFEPLQYSTTALKRWIASTLRKPQWIMGNIGCIPMHRQGQSKGLETPPLYLDGASGRTLQNPVRTELVEVQLGSDALASQKGEIKTSLPKQGTP